MKRSIVMMAVFGVMGLMGSICSASGFLVQTGGRHLPGLALPAARFTPALGSWAINYHHVDLRVRDQIAHVSVDQEFVNTARGMIEVEYLLPVPPGASIDSMTLVVDGKEFAAKLLKAGEARKIYEDIVRRKKDPALLEYVGFGLYKTRAFPLMPGKPAKVIVTYKQICQKDNGTVEVNYPLNMEKFSARTIKEVRVTADIKAAAPIPNVYSPVHSLNVKREAENHIVATYAQKNCLPTTDLQIFYKPATSAVDITFLTHQPDPSKDGYFLALVSPNPKKNGQAVQPKSVVVAFDHSGSMSGEKMRQARKAVTYVLKNLNAGDTFNVVAYNDGVESVFDSLQPATPKNIALAVDAVDRIEASGGTNISGAMAATMQLFAKATKGNPKYVLFMTDGIPTVGELDEKNLLAGIRRGNTFGARCFVLGVGYDVNVRLLDMMAGENGGKSQYVKPKEPIEQKTASLYNKIKDPVMTDLELSMTGVKLTQVYPRKLGDLFAGDQLVITGRYRREVSTSATSQLVVRGNYLGKERGFEYPVTLSANAKRLGYDFVEKLWATRRIGWLLDQIHLNGARGELTNEVVRLSQQYGIITPYTSFLADDQVSTSRPVVTARAERAMDRLSKTSTGASAQRAGVMRAELNEARQVSANMPVPAKAKEGQSSLAPSEVAMVGNVTADSYEAGKKDRVSGMRQVGNVAIYQRGKRWIASNAVDVDADKKDKASVQRVKRFSREYFELARLNTVAENRVFASQRAGEELQIALRGQVYLIE